MKADPRDLIHRYFDDALSETDFQRLQDWISAAPENQREFASLVLLHDQLHDHLHAFQSLKGSVNEPKQGEPPQSRVVVKVRPLLFGMVAVAVLLLCVSLWHSYGVSSASAAAEINRLIVAQQKVKDCTFIISVEEIAKPNKTGLDAIEATRPPKPPMQGATLHLRHGYQFVLIRKTSDGQPFVTGSDGETSWAVRPDGPVRVSHDIDRFSRDLPGHEHRMPLNDVEAILNTLQSAYEIQILPPELDTENPSDTDPTRLLVAVKKRGFRGPQRVEISYSANHRLIRQLRFVEMPYGPERLTLRLTLNEEKDLGPDFFRHARHHTADRIIEKE